VDIQERSRRNRLGRASPCPPFYDTRTFQSFDGALTYTTLLTQNNEEVKVQELSRHANSRITLDLYAQAGMPNKRLAQSKLVRMVLNKGEALA
jgi:hypothetical protein